MADRFTNLFPAFYKGAFSPLPQSNIERRLEILSAKLGQIPGLAIAPLRRFVSEGNIPVNRSSSSFLSTPSTDSSCLPLEIQQSLVIFQKDRPDPNKTAFIMMRFSKTKAHEEIFTATVSTLSKFGIEGLRADDKQYHDDLFPNILTYIYGCGFGIAVFERIEADEFNPNVSLEVGYK